MIGGRAMSVHLTVLVVLMSVSVCKSAEQKTNIDLRHLGLPVYMSNDHENETMLFDSFLKVHANSMPSLLSIMEQLVTNMETTDYCGSDVNLLLSNDSYIKPVLYKYIDAGAKIPYGILQGKWNWVGDYQECYDIEAVQNRNTSKQFKGLYSSGGIFINGKPVLMNTFPIVIGVCLPNSCNANDVKIFLNLLIVQVKAAIHKYFPVSMNVSVYETITDGNTELDSGGTAMLVITGILCFILLLSTLTDFFCSSADIKMDTRVKEDSNFDESLDDRSGLLNAELFSYNIQDGRCFQAKQKLLKICRVFSLISNGKKLIGTSTAVGPLACLNGIRVLSMWWVILGHTYAFIFAIVDNYAEAAKIVQRFSFQPIMNGTYSVDSFFFLSGLLVAYLALKEIKEKGRLSWPYYFIHRYWRLTPLYTFVIFYYAYLFDKTLFGPLKFFLEMGPYKETLDICKTHWWTNLLYINNMYPNYGNLGTTCVGWSWYLANDMQFYIVFGPLIILALSCKGRMKRFGVILTVIFILAGVVVRGFLIWYYGLYGSTTGVAPTKHVDDPWGKNGALYGRPYARYPVYLVGMLTGYLLSSSNNRIRINKVVAIVGWCVAIATGLAVVYGQYYYNHHPNTHMTLVQSVFYNALGRTAWGMCLAWIVIACVSGNGGPVKDILSWQIWAPLGRLTYAAYLVHPIIIYTYYFNMLQPLHFSDQTMVYMFISNLVFSYLVAFCVSMLVEAPMIQLEKLLLPSVSSFGNSYIVGPSGQLFGRIKNRFKRSA